MAASQATGTSAGSVPAGSSMPQALNGTASRPASAITQQRLAANGGAAMENLTNASPQPILGSMRTRFGMLSLAGLALSCLLGIFIGVSAFTFEAAKGGSYLSNDPRACLNCHIMRPQYDSWQKSSHHAFATCNDCHVPHDMLGKYFTKAENGYRHSWGFTFQDFHEPIQLHPRSRPIVQDNCVYCHGELMSQITAHETHWSQTTDCIRCHSSVGHGANR